jgi:hypothetical protein
MRQHDFANFGYSPFAGVLRAEVAQADGEMLEFSTPWHIERCCKTTAAWISEASHAVSQPRSGARLCALAVLTAAGDLDHRSSRAAAAANS